MYWLFEHAYRTRVVAIGRRCPRRLLLSSTSSTGFNQTNLRILIVDDHQLLRRGVRGLLESHAGFEVCGEAVDGLDAVTRAQELRPDAIVMDISMPNLNGLEATREIRRLLPQIQIVILSQHNSDEMIRAAISAGAQGYVVKSAISTDLIGALLKVSQHPGLPPPVSAAAHGITPDVKEVLQRGAVLENALRETQDRLRGLVEYQSAVMNNMVEGLFAVDADGLLTYVNPAAEAMLGWTREELLGRRFHDVAHYKHADGTPFPAEECPGLQVLHTGMPLREFEDVFIRRDGSFVPVIYSSSRLGDDSNPHGAVACFRDDTEARLARENIAAAQRELEIAHQHLQLITSTMAAAVSRCRRDLTYQWANQKYADWLQRPLDEIIGQSIENVLGAAAFRSLLPSIERVLCGEQIHYEQDLELPSLGRRWVMGSYTPVFGPDGKVEGWVAVIQDVTDRKCHEIALQRSEAALAAEIHALAELNALSSSLWRAKTLQEGLEQILQGVIDLLGANKGSVELLDTERTVLTMAAQRGFDEDYRDLLREMTAAHQSAAAQALRKVETVIIEDVETDPEFASLRDVANAGEYRALISVPLAKADGVTLGLVSAYFADPHRPSLQELGRLELYARQAADFVERFRAQSTPPAGEPFPVPSGRSRRKTAASPA